MKIKFVLLLSACLINLISFAPSSNASFLGNLVDSVVKEVKKQPPASTKQTPSSTEESPTTVNKSSKEYNEVLFYETIDIDTQKAMLEKKIKTKAIFKGITNRPKSGNGVSGWVNLNLCDQKQKSICDDLFLLKQSDFKIAYELEEDDKITIYGFIYPKLSGFGGHFRIDRLEKQN